MKASQYSAKTGIAVVEGVDSCKGNAMALSSKTIELIGQIADTLDNWPNKKMDINAFSLKYRAALHKEIKNNNITVEVKQEGLLSEISENLDYILEELQQHMPNVVDLIKERRKKLTVRATGFLWHRSLFIPKDNATTLVNTLRHVAEMARAELTAEKPTETERKTEPTRHSIDFRSVHWFGNDYNFTPNQAAAVKILWAAWENGTPDIGGDTLATNVESESRRARDIFKGHPAFGSMIKAGQTKGTYRLVEPDK